MEYQSTHSTAERRFRTAVLNGDVPDAITVAQLQARGIDVSALEARLRQSMEFKH
jgi:hypothetical protein